MLITRHLPCTALAFLAVSTLLLSTCPAALQAQGPGDPDLVGTWDFEVPGGYGEWKPLQNSSFEIRDGLVFVTAKSKRPCLDLVGPYDAEQIGAIEIRIRGIEVQRESPSGEAGSGMGGTADRLRVLPNLYQGTRIYFIRTVNEKYDAENSIEFELPLDGKFHVLTINPGEHPSWKGQIKKIRFDLGDFPHQYELDYIYFHRADTGGKESDPKDEATSTEPAKK